MDGFARVAVALADPRQPEVAFAALDTALAEAVGHRLFTVLVLDEARGVSRRAYSSRPGEYPVSGEKPILRNSEHHRLVVQQGVPRFVHDRGGIVRAFNDHELILSMGCEGAVNVPVRWAGRTIGGLNLLDRAASYQEAQIPLLTSFAALAIAPILRLIGEIGT